MRRERLLTMLVLAVASACGSVAPVQDAGGDASTDGSLLCQSSDNIAVCGGTNDCANSAACNCGDFGEPNNLGVCFGASFSDPMSGYLCSPAYYGDVCVSGSLSPLGGWADAKFNLGVLFAQNGGASRVRYGDLSLWTGDPLPDPVTCPNLGANVHACGGSCGTCPQGQNCYGGSPLHPVGFCAPFGGWCTTTSTALTCQKDGRGDTCFTFIVQPEAQADADQAGQCFPASDCAALATAIPGGGKCTLLQ